MQVICYVRQDPIRDCCWIVFWLLQIMHIVDDDLQQ